MHFAEVIDQKSLAGILRGFELLGISSDFPISSFVNGVSLNDSWRNISTVLDIGNNSIRNLLKSERDIQTLIHGDPTLSNVTTNLDGNIYLLDPIGARVLPAFTSGNLGLGRAHPVFDLARVNLSIEHEYERWASDIVVSMEGEEANYSLHDIKTNSNLKKELDTLWPESFKPKNDALTDLVYISTLARIFPYKAKNKTKEAFYLLGILNEKCKSFIDDYL
jgi:hypothetical protein